MSRRLGLPFRREARFSVCGFYSDIRYERLARRNIAEPIRDGSVLGVDRLFLYGPDDLDAEFRERHKGILRHARGYGYWCWKPYVILKALGELDEGDYLFYVDVDQDLRCLGHWLPPSRILRRYRRDIFIMAHSEWLEGHWTKRDVLIALGCDSAEHTESGQFDAGWQAIRKTRFAEEFLREWAALCQDEDLITDSPSAAPNLPGFVEHRHDQSLLSLLYKKRGFEPVTIHELVRLSLPLRGRLALGTRWRALKARLSSRAGEGGGGR